MFQLEFQFSYSPLQTLDSVLVPLLQHRDGVAVFLLHRLSRARRVLQPRLQLRRSETFSG